MKLRCEKHMRRVMILPGFKVIHRNDGSYCPTLNVEIGNQFISRETFFTTEVPMEIELSERDC